MLNLQPHVEGNLWPPMPRGTAASVQAILFQLEHSQWYTPEEIAGRQLVQLRALLQHARAKVPWYRERLSGLDPAKLETLDDAAWRELPRLARADIQEAGEAMHSEALPEGHGRSAEIFTSGSTGRPIRVLRSELSGAYRAAVTMRDHIWHRRVMTGKLAALRDTTKGKHLYPTGTRSRGWSPITRAIFRNGPGVSLNVNTPLEQQIEWLQREAPDYLLTFPTIVRDLANYCIEKGVSLPSLKQVETISEVLTGDLRALCREAWDVPLVDLYSSREVGYLGLQCPDHEHLHVPAETTLLEVVDEAGRACGPGEVGKVLVTPLQNFAMPLIRYEIGDYAEVGEACPCGRGLPVLKRVLGRVQNQVRLPGGETRWPLLSSNNIEALLAIAPIRQYQIVQTSHEALEVRLVCDPPLDAMQRERLERWVADKFHHPFAVEVRYLAEIPRTASGKYFDFLCELS